MYSDTPSACRLCLSESEFQLLIFGDTGQRLGIHFKLQSCFPTLQVTQQDGLPDSICYRCLFSLEQTYDFWTKCCTTEAILSNSKFKNNHQVIHEQKALNCHPRETFPHTADDADWDDWFIWDATYKIPQTENKYSQHTPVTHHSKNQGNNPSLLCQSAAFGDSNQIQMSKKSNDLFKCDFLQEDIPWINENQDMMKIVDSDKSTSKTNAANFSLSFWKQNPLNAKIQKNTNPLSSSLHPSFGKPKEQAQKDSNSHYFKNDSLSFFSEDKKSITKLFNQYGCHMFSTNNEINSKKKCPLVYNASIYDDVLTNATNLLQRFRANNSLYY